MPSDDLDLCVEHERELAAALDDPEDRNVVEGDLATLGL
jgi:hypothetical protein